MKATFEFNFDEPEDIMEHHRMTHATNMACALWEITHNLKRRMEIVIDYKSPSAQEILEETMERIHEIMEEHQVIINDLIR